MSTSDARSKLLSSARLQVEYRGDWSLDQFDAQLYHYRHSAALDYFHLDEGGVKLLYLLMISECYAVVPNERHKAQGTRFLQAFYR